jgi:hypothetical protein
MSAELVNRLRETLVVFVGTSLQQLADRSPQTKIPLPLRDQIAHVGNRLHRAAVAAADANPSMLLWKWSR